MAASRRPVTAAERARREQQRQVKLDATRALLTQQASRLGEPHGWHRFLELATRFPGYSGRSVLLIAAQRPDATRLADYDSWQRDGHQVGKGERGIRVLTTDRDGHERLAHLFDISQTSATDPARAVPAAPDRSLTAEQVRDGLVAAAGHVGYRVQFPDDPPSAGGGIDPRRGVITVASGPGTDPHSTTQVLAHELGHVLVEHQVAGAPDADGEGCFGVAAVEADAVAYLAAARHGLDMPVPAAADSEDPAASAERVCAAANALEQYLTRAAASRTVVQTPPQLRTDADVAAERAHLLRRRAANTAALAAGEPSGDRDAASRQVLTAAHTVAWRFYRSRAYVSWVPQYLRARGLGGMLTSGSRWQAGYAPDRWTALTDHLRGHGYSEATLQAAGLAQRSRTGGLIDRFRDRLMLPVHDPGDGAIVAFIGRARAADRNTPKYLNSPETGIYRKGEVLLGLAENAAELRAGARPVLVEGVLDAAAVTAATDGTCVGVTPSGTALTGQQIAALDHAVAGLATRGVLVGFDGDAGGQAAAARSFELLTPVVPTDRLLTVPFPHGEDPAAVLTTSGPDTLATRLVTADTRLADAVVDARIAGWSDQLDTPEGRSAALRDTAGVLARLTPREMGRQVQRLGQRPEFVDQPQVATAIAEAIPSAVTRGTDYLSQQRRRAGRDQRDDLDRGQHLDEHTPPDQPASRSYPEPLQLTPPQQRHARTGQAERAAQPAVPAPGLGRRR